MSNAKAAAGRLAASLVQDGMRLGLGTGSTVRFFLEALAQRIREERMTVSGIPTSLDTERRCHDLGIALADWSTVQALDLVVDGADEIDGEFRLIKGGGGALLREKVVAQAGREMCVVVDAGKRVARLGSTFDLPVEVVPFAFYPVRRAIERLGGIPRERRAVGNADYRTDNGNLILDVHFAGGIADPERLEADLDRIVGVVESGLFLGLARSCIVGHEDGRAELIQRAISG